MYIFSVLCLQFIQQARTLNMELNKDFSIKEIDDRCNVRDRDDALNYFKNNGCKILFCIIPDFGNSYANVKQAAEIRCGILTQCIKAGTVYRKGRDLSTINNILLKVNAKLNGTNHKLDQNASPILNGKCMVIGADVTHPSPEQTRIPR